MSSNFGTVFKRTYRRCLFLQDLRRRSMTPTVYDQHDVTIHIPLGFDLLKYYYISK
jgi:hypothetical protein